MRAWLHRFAAIPLLSAVLFGQASAPGHVVYSAAIGTDSFLVDESGTIVHTWPGSNATNLSCYLLPNGNLIRTFSTGATLPPGSTGGFEVIAWDGSPVWQFQYDSAVATAHHDFEPLPNGNLLLIAWQKLSDLDGVAAGRDPATMTTADFWPLEIVEVQPTGPGSGQVVWRWRLIDHVIQDHDPVQANFGDPALHPERVDINFPPTVLADGDWVHANGIDYNAALDQILISANHLDEIWVIDHSTTTAEAAGSTGGNSGRGGDLLYRWGNPIAYRAGTTADQQLFHQHDPTWIEPGRPGAGDILIFNNGGFRPTGDWSSVEQITPPLQSGGIYALAPGTAFGPATPNWLYSDSPNFFSRIMSGAERLSNGNTLICEAVDGRIFEVDSAGAVVWDYTNPFPSAPLNLVFKAHRYEHYLWLDRANLSATAGGTIEFDLQVDSSLAGEPYILLASATGTAPGRPLAGGAVLPLNIDRTTRHVLAHMNGGAMPGFQGVLDTQGGAHATLDLHRTLPAVLVGRTIHFAFAVGSPPTFASNPASIQILP